MRHAIPTAVVALLASVLPALAQAEDAATKTSPLANPAPEFRDEWNSFGGYAGLSGGVTFGAGRSDWSTLNNDKLRYTDDAPADTGWQTTVEGGVVMPLSRLEWLRLRVGGELGYSHFDLNRYHDNFSGDTVSGNVGMLRVGPAAAVDFRIPRTPWSFTAGVGVGAAFLDMDTRVSNGPTTRDTSHSPTTAYASGLVAVNYALERNVDLSLGYRGIWLDNARIDGTPTTVGGATYAVHHQLRNVGAIELGLRVKF